MFYCGLIHVHQDKSGKCWHAHRFGSPLAGSEPRLPRLYFISSCPFPAAGHVLEPGPRRGRVHVGGIEGDGGGGGGLVGLLGGCSRRSLLPSRSFRWTAASESNLNATGRPRCCGPLAVVSESHPSGEPERFTNLATSQLASSIQFQVCDRLSFTVQVCDPGLWWVSSWVPSFSRLRHVSFKFLNVRYRLSFRVASFSRLRPVVPPSSRLVTAPGAVTPPGSAGPRPLAELDNISRSSRQGPWLLTGRKSRQPIVCSAAAMAHRNRPSVMVTPVISTQIQAIRRAVCRQRRPSVPTVTHWPLVAVWARLRSGLQSPLHIARCIRVGQGWVVIAPSRPVTRSESTVSHGSRHNPCPLLRPGGLRCWHHMKSM